MGHASSLRGSGDIVTEADLRAAFREPVQPVPVKTGYKLGLLLVAFATVILPLIYVGLIGLAIYGVYAHATGNMDLLEGRGKGRFFAYVTPIVVGAVLVLFMVKPLFAKPARRPKTLVVGRTRAPRLWAFVEEVRRAVHAPAPREIVVDCDVNASAAFRRGLSSFAGNDLKLTIGLPLVAGMTLRQLAGVLAHEFGHFAQGSGMRLTYLIRSVNMWLARVVYERDEWDEKLESASKRWDFRIAIILLVARFMVWASRKILWVLMMAGHFLGTFMLRHMEYDADRYEARLAGSDTFASTAKRLRVLSVASRKAISSLAGTWNEGRLCDDYPTLVATSAGKLPRDVLQAIESDDHARKASAFDTHPPDAARIASAQAEKAPGIFTMEVPAHAVVDDWQGLVREATLLFYSENHDIEARSENLMPLAAFVAHQDEVDAGERVVGEYLHGLFAADEPLGLPATLSAPTGGLSAQLAAVDGQRRLAASEIARLRSTGGEDADKAVADPAVVAQVRRVVRERVLAALALLETPVAEAAFEDVDATRAEVARFWSVLRALEAASPSIKALGVRFGAAVAYMNQHQENSDSAEIFDQLTRELGCLADETARLLVCFEGVPYPFDHVEGKVSVAVYAARELPELDEWNGAALPRARGVMERLHTLYERAIGRLAVLAERLEGQVSPTSLQGGSAA
jgi:Zn-dependent protease with chaperone function